MPPTASIERCLAALREGRAEPVYLVVGELVVAEARGQELAEALADGRRFEIRRRPEAIGAVLDDLLTFSLFERGKVVLVVDSGVLGDRNLAAELIVEARAVTPFDPAKADPAGAREAAIRLLQALRLSGVDPLSGGTEASLDRLPDGVLAARGGRKVAAARRAELAPLLEWGRTAGLVGWGEGDTTRLGDLLETGLPEGHHLVLVERSVAADHPVRERLEERGAVVVLAGLSSDRGEWHGLSEVAAELTRQTGVRIERDALRALAERTLRSPGRRGELVEGDSAARLAGEYRKLALLAGAGPITREQVESAVVDRGDEDVWQLLDEIAAGRGGAALTRLDRLFTGATNPIATTLSFFSLLAGFCRQLVGIGGAVEALGLPRHERNYRRFKDQLAGRLVEPVVPGVPSTLKGLHPFRLHRAYLAATRVPSAWLRTLPWRVLETELLLKGEGSDARAALADLVVEVASAIGGRSGTARRT